MGNIFGDTDDITFGSSATPPRPPRDDRTEAPARPVPAPRMTDRAHSHQDRPRTESRPPRPPVRSPERSGGSMAPSEPISLAMTLTNLVTSMKPTYLPPLTSDTIRIVILSSSSTPDPLMLVRTGDVTLLVGTGFSSVESSGKNYPTFPDMRLIQSEKEHLAGWVLLEPGFDIVSFQMTLEMLGFPFVYGTRDVIAYIRDMVKDTGFLDKCRFFELFASGIDDRKIAEFTLKNTTQGLSIGTSGKTFIDAIHMIDSTAISASSSPVLSKSLGGYTFANEGVVFTSGEIVDMNGSKVTKNTLKFTFDTFYRDQKSIGVVAGYALKDREELAGNGVLTFVLEEDAHARAIVGHIFIDSRGFVHAYEMMSVHKQILRGIRHIYEGAIMSNPRIERGELVQTLRRELTKYCYLITGRTPVVMPIIIER